MMENTTGAVEMGVTPGCQDVRWLGMAEMGIGEYARIRSASAILAVVIAVVIFDALSSVFFFCETELWSDQS
jgi:hypothetical protein